MIRIHATWKSAPDRSDTGLFLWGEFLEDMSLTEEDLDEIGRDLPFTVPSRGLRTFLRDLADGLVYECSEEDEAWLLWPTRKGFPLLSNDGAPREASLERWRVDGLRIPPQDTPSFLRALEAHPPEGIEVGPTLDYWGQATRFALSLIERGRFLPTLVEENDSGRRSLRAHWRPVLAAEDDRARLRDLGSALPFVCRTLSTDGEVSEEAANTEPRQLLGAFLENLTDATLRLRLAEAGFPDRGRRSQSRTVALTGPIGAWLRSLAWIDDRIDSPPQSLEDFATEVRRWNQTLVDPEGGTYRLLLQLLPPSAPEPREEEAPAGTGAENGSGDPGPAAPAAPPESAEVAGESPVPALGEGARGPVDPQENGRVSALDVLVPVEKSPWRIRLFLQACDDPSLLAPASAVWAHSDVAFRWKDRQFPYAQERLLAYLDRATRIFPPLRRALEDPAPAVATLRVEEAYSFLVESTEPMKEAGIHVELPSWWMGRARRPELRLFLRPAGAEPGSGETTNVSSMLLDYDWEIALGDTVLTPEQFHELARSKRPLLQVGGEWIELRPEDTEILDHVLQDKTKRPQLTLAEALRLGLGGQTPRGTIPPPQIHAEGWVAQLLAQVQGRAIPDAIEIGEEFKGTLRPYQERGLGWLFYLEQFGLGGCLADDMGLGKTIQLIGLLLHERSLNPDAHFGPTLVLSPMSVVGNWQREIERFAPSLTVRVHHGVDRTRDHEFIEVAEGNDVVVSTYALARRDLEHFQRVKWRRIVLDEAQNIKNPTTQQSRAVRSLEAARRIALTGTPLENRLAELWSIFDFLNPGYLGSLHEFRRRFAKPIEKDGNPERRQLLHQLTRPFLLRRLKTDPDVIRDLPEKLEMRVFCNLTEEQASLYQAIVEEMMNRIDTSQGMTRRGLILTALTRLKQICNHPRHYLQDGGDLTGRSGKVERLAEMLEELLSVGDRALCFTQFTEMGLLLEEHLKKRLGVDVLFLHGGTPQLERDRMVAEFQTGVGPPIFLLSTRAGGTGLNLTAANHVFHFDRWWNPAVEDQATDRAFRIGQTRNVQVHKFVCVGTLEERIDKIIEEKKNLVDLVLATGESWLTELSTDQLREVLQLSQDAVSV